MRELAAGHEERKKNWCLQRFLELIRWAAEERGGTAVRVDRCSIEIGMYSDSQIDFAIGKLKEMGYAVVRPTRWWQKLFGEKIVIGWWGDES